MSDSIIDFAMHYGNKAAKLQEMMQICPDNVPRFHPISSQDVNFYLDNHAPKWRKLWKLFQESQGNKPAITPDSINILEELRALILQTFEKTPMHAENISNFLTDVAQDRLMVLSSGYEDNIDVANPLENECVFAVLPNILAISKAMGIVVASYFSEKSLKQRLLMARSCIVNDAIMPILLQKMVGEPLNGFIRAQDIVRSGLVYTSEGMARIQVAPGDGQLVVNRKGWFDTFIVTAEEVIYPAIVKKVRRLVPTKKGLDWTENPPVLQEQASISNQVIKRLVALGRQIEQHYGMPMDVEFIYDPKVDEILILQARSIPKSRVLKRNAVFNMIKTVTSSINSKEQLERLGFLKDGLITSSETPTSSQISSVTCEQAYLSENAKLDMFADVDGEFTLRSFFSKIVKMPIEKNIHLQLLHNLEILEAAQNTASIDALNTIRYIFYKIVVSESRTRELSFLPQIMILCDEIECKLASDANLILGSMREEYLILIARLKSLISSPVIYYLLNRTK